MSLFKDGMDSLGIEMTNIIGNMETVFNPNSKKSNNSTTKIPLSEKEITAFRGLCAMEGKSARDKMAELVKDYIEKKRQQMEK